MDQHNLGYSLKNIPIPSETSYLKCLISKVESLIRRVRWKALFFEIGDSTDNKETYGFKTENSPPQNPALDEFENEMYDLISNVQFNKKRNSFQKTLMRDVKKITKSQDLLIHADKSTNLYAMKPDKYNRLLFENVTKNYRKADEGTKNLSAK